MPRLVVFRSAKHIYAQIIDKTGKVLVSVSEKEIKIKKEAKPLTKTEKARFVGQLVAQKAINKKIQKIVFDRGAYHYHGRVKNLAEAVRKGGLKF